MRIGIVGAGLAGLSAAAFLSKSGHKVEILEQANNPQPVGAGILLQPPGIKILEELGALNDILPTGAKITRLLGKTKNQKVLMDLNYKTINPDLFGLGLKRTSVWKSLFDQCLNQNIPIESGFSAIKIGENKSQAWVQNEQKRTKTYDLLIVASGAHSSLWNNENYQTNLYPWGCLWATVELPNDWDQTILQQYSLGTQRMMGILPLGTQNDKPVAALFWSLKTTTLKDLTHQQWLQQVEKLWPTALPLAKQLDWSNLCFAAYRDNWSNPPYMEKTIVIGDVAHGTSPQLGQGTTQALRDALALRDVLSKDQSLKEQLSEYWKIRQARTRYYRWSSRLITPFYQGDSQLLGFFKDNLSGPILNVKPVRKQALLTLIGAKNNLFTAENHRK